VVLEANRAVVVEPNVHLLHVLSVDEGSHLLQARFLALVEEAFWVGHVEDEDLGEPEDTRPLPVVVTESAVPQPQVLKDEVVEPRDGGEDDADSKSEQSYTNHSESTIADLVLVGDHHLQGSVLRGVGLPMLVAARPGGRNTEQSVLGVLAHHLVILLVETHG